MDWKLFFILLSIFIVSFLVVSFELRKQPTKLNWWKGYRTGLSMLNERTWKYANDRFYT
jgi:hypothetical protein